jgi:anti-sigma B factor antagonist
VTATVDPSSDELITLSVVTTDTSARVSTTGEVDSSSAPRLQAELEGLLDSGFRQLTVDLDGVTFLDSAGLCALAAVHRRATADGGRMRVLASHRAVIRPLQITGLWELLGVEQIAPGSGATA